MDCSRFLKECVNVKFTYWECSASAEVKASGALCSSREPPHTCLLPSRAAAAQVGIPVPCNLYLTSWFQGHTVFSISSTPCTDIFTLPSHLWPLANNTELRFNSTVLTHLHKQVGIAKGRHQHSKLKSTWQTRFSFLPEFKVKQQETHYLILN